MDIDTKMVFHMKSPEVLITKGAIQIIHQKSNWESLLITKETC